MHPAIPGGGIDYHPDCDSIPLVYMDLLVNQSGILHGYSVHLYVILQR